MNRRLAFWTIAMVALTAPQLLPQQTAPQPSPQTGGVPIRVVVTQAGTAEGIPDVQIALTPVAFRGGAIAARGGFNANFDAQTIRELGAQAGATEAEIEQLIAARGARVAALNTGNATVAYSGVSDAAGRFTMADVLPGAYTFTAQREGYLPQPANTAVAQAVINRQILVTAGQPVLDITISLVRGGAISGRVVDASGQSVSNANVEALRATYQNGHQVLQPSISKSTDDRGEFRLFWLPPGEYVVAATPAGSAARGARFGGGARGNTAATTADTPVRTFYPREVDPGLAVKVLLESGRDAMAANVAIRTARTFTIRGQVGTTIPIAPVIGPAGQARGGQLNLTLVPRTEPGESRPATGTVTLDQSGKGPFEISSLLPGSYDLVARIPLPIQAPAALARGGNGGGGGAIGQAFGRLSLEVRGDMDGIAFTVPPPVELKGTVVFGDTTETRPASVRIGLVTKFEYGFPAYAGLLGAQVTTTPGSFTLPSVFQGDYFVQVVMLAADARGGSDAYVEDVRQGGASIYDSGFTIEGGTPPAPLQILLNASGGSVEGTVFAADRKPAPGVSVVLVPAMQRRKNASLYRTVTADAAGRFAIRGIAPGDYKLFSWEEFIPTAAQNAVYMQKYEARGQPVTIRSLTTATADVTVIGRN